MRQLFILILVISLAACSTKFHGDPRLLGTWRPLQPGLSDIYFDKTRYFIMDADSTKTTAYGLYYKVEGNILTTYSGNSTYSVSKIVKISADTIVLKDEKTDSDFYYIKK
ncbi:MAG: hypothetical protein WCH52_00625 [Bacteroidota bacterium]